MNNKFLIPILSLALLLLVGASLALNYFKSGKVRLGGFIPEASSPPQSEFELKAEAALGPKLSLVSSTANPTLGQNFSVEIFLKPEGKTVQALDAIILFDQEKLTALNILALVQENDAEYPQIKYDNEAGRLAVSLILPQTPLVEETSIAMIEFQGKQPGETVVGFDFAPGETTDSNVILQDETQDSLSAVENLTINLAEGQQP